MILFLLKGAAASVLISFTIMMWMGFGAQTLKGHEPPLPPVSTANCSSPSPEVNTTTLLPLQGHQYKQEQQTQQMWTVDQQSTTMPPQTTSL